MNEDAFTRRAAIQVGIMSGAVGASPLALAQTSSQPGGLTTAPTSQSGLSPRLTMHAIDTFHGTPGAGMRCDLSVLDGDKYRHVKTVTTAENGRTAEALL